MAKNVILHLKLAKDQVSVFEKSPIVLSVRYGSKCRSVYTGLQIEPSYFNKKEEQVIYARKSPYSFLEVTEMNRHLLDIRECVLRYVEQFREDKFSVDDIVSWYRQRCKKEDLFSYFEWMIEEKLRTSKHGTACAYQSTLNSLRAFCKGKSVCFSRIDYSFTHDYEHYLQIHHVSANTIAYYMRNFRTVYFRAKAEGLFYGYSFKSPFDKLKLTPAKTIKRALTSVQIRSILTLDLAGRPQLEFARDLFMASFYLRGIAFVDLVHLRKADLTGNIIQYCRQKTSILVSVEILPPLQVILQKYSSDSPWLFPLLPPSFKSGTSETYAAYRRSLYYYNRRLKQIGKLANLSVPLTGYVARHSWATSAKNKGASTAVISEALGHSSERITQIYLKSFDNSVINNINSLVAEL